MAIWTSGIEFIDRFISDDAVTVLEILQYFDAIGSYDSRDKIIFRYNNDDQRAKRGSRRQLAQKIYRVDADDIVKKIKDFLSKVDQNIFNIVLKEFIYEEEKKYMDFKYENYAKFYIWEEKNFNRVRDDNYISFLMDVHIWKEFIEIKKKRGVKIDELFKIAVIRFLEKRLDVAIKELSEI